MSKTAVQLHFESILAGVRQPARYIGEEPGAGPGFGGSSGELRVVVAFPDTYEIGISNQALQILYHLARQTAGVAVERAYLPWVDAIDAMRRERVPLLTQETWTPVVSADLLGITLQHEFSYTNVLELLDLAGIPIHAAERADEHPLVLGGGPGCANFLPLGSFFDGFVVGDGEEILPDILRVLLEAKSAGVPRVELRQRLSCIEGVYVPGISRGVERRIAARLEGAPYPDSCLVPLSAGVHDRAWIEVMRGCTRGCRFCQAGMWYRPVRERPAEEVLRMAAAQLDSSGHHELAFASLSTTDYSHIAGVLAAMAESHPEVRVSLPSLRVDSAAVRLAQIVSPTGPSLTLAPEAGSARMWSIINKNVTEDDVVAAVREAFRTGRTTLKLYFMIGFPLEEDDDVVGIADLCLRIREVGREMLSDRKARLQLNISVNNFIPKPFTPFQWAGMADRTTLRRRQELLRARLKRPGIRLALHSVDKSHLEAALARGGDEMADIIADAWRDGARFDNWTEQFSDAAWTRAFETAGMTAERLATTSFPRAARLPWDVISGVVDRDFLWEEWEKAVRTEVTPDCRWDACTQCGACDGWAAGTGLARARGGETATDTVSAPCEVSDTAGGPRPARETPPAAVPAIGPRWRYVATFSVTGRGRFIGHLDRTEILRRALRRAGGKLALSGSMRPKPLLSLALPLAVGVEGLHELCEFELAEPASANLFDRLSRAIPAHMTLLALEPYEHAKSVPARVVGALYEVRVRAARTDAVHEAVHADLCPVLEDAARRFAAAAELPVEESREGVIRRVDVRLYVEQVAVARDADESCLLSYRAAVIPTGSARPERVVDALSALAGVGLRIDSITRLQVLLA